VTATVHPLSDRPAREAIAARLDDTLIVEAAAGTGKTTELVGRVVTVLAEGRAQVGEIVAVTFTEKAAGELKLKLRERLDRARTAAAADAGRRARLDEALKGLEEAHVSTIHGFCADLLRERPVEARIDPLFEVLNESGSARLFDEAFGRWLQEQLADPPEGVRRALRRAAFGGEGGPVDRLRKAAWELAQWRDFPAPWSRPEFDRLPEIDAAVAELHELAALTRHPSTRNDPLHAATEPVRRLSDEIALQRSAGEAEGTADYDGWEAALVSLSRDRTFANAKTGRGAAFAQGIPRDRVLQARAALKTRLDQFRMAADADLAALLQRDLRGAIDRYDELKARAGALDFLDLLLGARNLVRDNAMVRRGFQARFKRIFVDEFQDTDPLQAEILLLLAADDDEETDWRQARPRPGTLFLVGDPKQSIYRFRRADVGVYREVCERLESLGASVVRLRTSFRSVPEIQACVNNAFAPVMTGDPVTLQAPYVALTAHRAALPGQPAVVTLPVPEPYKWRYVSAGAIEQSLPGAVAAFVEWVLRESRWMVTERSGEAPVAVAAKHVCLLFRRFVSWQNDVTRPYVEALEARGIPHVLVGGKAFHEREEVEAIRAALAAIEWPDDELSVFSTLRGPFFAVGDEALLEWTHHFGSAAPHGFRRYPLHPFRVPAVFDGEVPEVIRHLRPVADALLLLKQLHRRRNYVPVSQTLHRLLDATRAHVGFALRTAGEQALANVFHVAELARQFEAGGGISFRGFVEELRLAAENAVAAEAPILEEDSDGVRMMTVHKAKGLEFPIVILADLTCHLSRPEPSRWIDAERGLCAIKLAGWAPDDLRLQGDIEVARDRAEGQRLAYVAATRARDVLVIPAVGDEVYDGGWLDPLMPAIYPSIDARRDPAPAPGCPAFPSKDTVLTRGDGDPARPTTVAPGMFEFPVAEAVEARDGPIGGPRPAVDSAEPDDEGPVQGGPRVLLFPSARPDPGSRIPDPDSILSTADRRAPSAKVPDPGPPIPDPDSILSTADRRAPSAKVPDPGSRIPDPGTYHVVWWDPHSLVLQAPVAGGLRRDDLIAKDGDQPGVERRMGEYRAWQTDRAAAVTRGKTPSIVSQTATDLSRDRTLPTRTEDVRIEVVDLPRAAGRPFGPRFGSLVHATLATVALDADAEAVLRIARTHARVLLADNQEAAAAAEAVTGALAHPLFARVRAAGALGRSARECPVMWRTSDGSIVEGTVDVVFEEGESVTILDFKTDREPSDLNDQYQRQLTLYCRAFAALRRRPVEGVLVRI
jgi:ATP-dependent exoDNAse (exonuclease V) beta subunit